MSNYIYIETKFFSYYFLIFDFYEILKTIIFLTHLYYIILYLTFTTICDRKIWKVIKALGFKLKKLALDKFIRRRIKHFLTRYCKKYKVRPN